jgi:hypothetical protein
MSAISANSAVFARKALAGAKVASKRAAVKSSAAFGVSANAKVDACDKNSVIVSPSILSANFATLGAEVRSPPPHPPPPYPPPPPATAPPDRVRLGARAPSSLATRSAIRPRPPLESAAPRSAPPIG